MARKAKRSKRGKTKCPWGKLKHKIGRRVCRKRPGKRRAKKQDSTTVMKSTYFQNQLEGYRRRKSRR